MTPSYITAAPGAAHKEQATKRKRGRRGGRRRGKTVKLEDRLAAAYRDLSLAVAEGRQNDAQRLITDIFGRDHFWTEGLWHELREARAQRAADWAAAVRRLSDAPEGESAKDRETRERLLRLLTEDPFWGHSKSYVETHRKRANDGEWRTEPETPAPFETRWEVVT